MRSDQDKRIDAHVGRRVRLRRTLLGMSQSALGQAVERRAMLTPVEG
jgi:hypothetical protein